VILVVPEQTLAVRPRVGIRRAPYIPVADDQLLKPVREG
jgi:hypothetical protein